MSHLHIGNRALDELNRTWALNTYLLNKSVEAGLLPAARYVSSLHSDLAGSVLAVARGERSAGGGLRDLYHRTRAGVRFERLVHTLGAELFGSATFAGETVVAETDHFRLSYLPPLPGVGPSPGVSVFHVGGFLPYGDRVFRLLPEANLYQAFLSRGLPVYAMELRDDHRERRQVGRGTLRRLIDAIDQMSDAAFCHASNGRRKMIAEGYCGLAMPALAFVAARPEQAEARFDVLATMVAPIDGRECTLLSDFMQRTPHLLRELHAGLAVLRGGEVGGRDLCASLDIPLDAVVQRAPLGRFAAGWARPVYAYLDSIDELDQDQRRELAGAYWISAHNSRRYPMPADLVRFFGRLFCDGIDEDLLLPATYRGRPLSLRAIAEQTTIRVVGFYGGQDRVVPHDTARVLQRALGRRYTHVVHPRTGHFSYVLSPELWSRQHPRALRPDPIDLLLKLQANHPQTFDPAAR